MTHFLFAPLALVLVAPPVFAGNFSTSVRGTTAGEFLNLGAGARAAAMGGAYSAVADEASAVYWNPAAMTRVERRSVTLMHSVMFNSTSYEYGSYVQNEGRIGAFGFGAQYYTPGRLAQTSEAGASVGTLVPYDMALSWSYARKFRSFSFGGTAKIVDSRIINSASAGAFDLGVLSPGLLGERLRLAFAATNLGGDTMVFDRAGAVLPLSLRGGGAYQISPNFLVSADAVFPKSDQPYAAVGVESGIIGPGPRSSKTDTWSFFARAGYNTQTISSVDGFTGASIGFGVLARHVAIDYGFAPFGGLGQVHRLSLTCAF